MAGGDRHLHTQLDPDATLLRTTPGSLSRISPGTRDLEITPANAHVEFTIGWMRVATVRGAFSDFEGRIQCPDGDPEHATITVRVRTASIGTGIRLRDRHLRGPGYFDCTRFPLATFTSRKVDPHGSHVLVTGALKIRGVERDTTLACVLRSGWRPGEILVLGEFQIGRADYAVGPDRASAWRWDPRPRAIGPDVLVRIRVTLTAGTR